MNQTESPVISRRQKTAGPFHHLWNNHGHWWLHATVHLKDNTANRVRINLRTRDLDIAMAKRDRILDSTPRVKPIPAA